MSNRLTRWMAVAAGMAVAVSVAFGAEGGWGTDFEAAKKAAAEKNLPVMINFTGSDWCRFCKMLHAEVFEKKAFQDYAKESLVLLEIDSPMRKALDPALKEQNARLKKEFGIRGFPTIVLLDAKGVEIARTGYRQGGAEAYVEHVKELIAAAAAKPAAAQ